jgi:hypothetical protein
MKTYILVGEVAVNHLQNEDWRELELSILVSNGDIISWDSKTDHVAELLESLKGWSDFQVLSTEDIYNIKTNTNIEIV